MKTIAYTIALLIGFVGYYIMPVDASCQQSDCPCGSFCLDADNKWCNSNSNADCECRKGCMHYDTFMQPGSRGETVHCNNCNCPENPKTGRPRCSRNGSCDFENLREGVDFPYRKVFEACEE